MTPAEFVLDASVVVRGLLLSDGSAVGLVDDIAKGAVVAHGPDLVVPEVTNALRTHVVGAGRWPLEAAQERLSTFLALPIAIQPCMPLAPAALTTAVERGFSAYDAFYAVLAEALDVPLATADRRLAAAVPNAILVS